MTRREMLAFSASAALLTAQNAPAAPVSIARCRSYEEDLNATLGTMFDQIGGLKKLVGNKTVTIKLNLTGSPGLRFQGKPLGVTHYSHPRTLGPMLNLMGNAGAKRIRLVESCWGTGGPLEDYLLDSGWNVRALKTAAPNVVFENTNALGTGKKYASFKVPGKAYIFPAYELNEAYADTDVFMSMAKLKNHATCGVTLAMKNCFGNTPASIYGDDAGVDEPNEKPTKGRLDVCHYGKRQPAKIAASELDPGTSREPEYRMPRITAELIAARPLDISFIDGVETMAGGEGPWVPNKLSHVKPGVLILGTNGVSTDAVGTAVMGYDPRAPKGTAPFVKCDNTLLLAEALGVGSADLKKIEVRGLPIEQAVFRFDQA
ncbi:MAG TPA: DUF362 domain-containing protein [Bryobacteraceae bacterium]|nr:DUF362 domain-containing protein [Bryobacteraceae bacterium]